MVPAAPARPLEGLLIGDVLNDHRAFGELFAVVEFKARHLPFRVYGPIILTGLGLLFLIIDLLEFEVRAGLAQHDMGRQRAGTGGKIKLHRSNLLGGRFDGCVHHSAAPQPRHPQSGIEHL
jgi:hypothetical protein